MWPFKKTKAITFIDYINKLPTPPCKDKEVHYYWTTNTNESNACPKCANNIRRRNKKNDSDILAEKIAEKVAKKLNPCIRLKTKIVSLKERTIKEIK